MTDPPDLHAVEVRRTAVGFLVTCRCGHWEGWFNGAAGQAAVEDDWDHHRRASSNGANLPPVQ